MFKSILFFPLLVSFIHLKKNCLYEVFGYHRNYGISCKTGFKKNTTLSSTILCNGKNRKVDWGIKMRAVRTGHFVFYISVFMKICNEYLVESTLCQMENRRYHVKPKDIQRQRTVLVFFLKTYVKLGNGGNNLTVTQL